MSDNFISLWNLILFFVGTASLQSFPFKIFKFFQSLKKKYVCNRYNRVRVFPSSSVSIHFRNHPACVKISIETKQEPVHNKIELDLEALKRRFLPS